MNQNQEKIAGIKKQTFIMLFVLFLFLLNSILKFYGIHYSSFWIDEAYSVSEAQRNLAGIVQDCAATDNPPLYFILLHYWINVFGISEFAVRSLSAVFSIVTSLLLFYYAKKNLGLKTAIFVSLLFSVSTQHLYYAQETRNYALVFMLAIFSAISFSDLFSSGKVRAVMFLTLANILLIYTHFMAGFLVACEGIVALLFIKSKRKFFVQVVLSCVCVILCILPWLANVFNHIPEAGKFWLEKPTFYNFKGLYIDFAGNKVATVIMFGIIAFGCYKLIRQWMAQRDLKQIFSAVFFITWTFLIPVLVYFIAQYRPVFLTRYLLYCSIGMYLATGLFLMQMQLKPVLSGSIAILLLVSMTISLKLHPAREEHWRDAVELVKRIKTGNDVVILSVYYTNNIFSYYYDKNIFRQYNDVEKLLNKENIFSMSKLDNTILNSLPSTGRIILVQSHQIDDDPENTVGQTLASNARRIVTADYDKVQVSVFSRIAQ